MSQLLLSNELGPDHSVVKQLNESRGVMDTENLVGFEFDMDKRTNITTFAKAIGKTLHPFGRNGEFLDEPLEVYPYDFVNAEPELLNTGLYIPLSNPLRRQNKISNLAIVWGTECTLDIGGVQDPRTGVVVSKGEYKTIVHTPQAMTAHSKAMTRDANLQNPIREEALAKIGRAAAHTMDSKLKALTKLDAELVQKSDVIRAVRRDARSVWRTPYLAKNLDVKRKETDEFIHETVETVAYTLNFGTTTINALHRAIASNLYRRGSSQDLAKSWRGYTNWAGLYVNAKRGKVNQSYNGAMAERLKYVEYLPLDMAA